MYKFSSLFLIVLLTAIFSCKKDNNSNTNPSGGCSGIVTDQYNNPIAGAVVTINTTPSVTVKTDGNGSFSANNIRAGSISLSATASDYISDTKSITITANSSVNVVFKLKTGVNTLSVDKDSIGLASTTSSGSVSITSNAPWLVTDVPSWLQIDETKGQGNHVLTFTAQADTSDTVRTAIVSVTAGTLIKKIKIRQNVVVKLLSYPNGNSLIADSVKLTFNQAVKVVSITPEYTNCIGDYGFSYFDNNRGVKFHYGCGSIGGSYPFTVTVTDEFGTSSSIKFTAQYYTQKYIYNQHGLVAILPVCLTNSGFWMAESTDSDFPTLLAFYSASDLSILKTFRFNFRFAGAAYNPINHLFYIIGRGTNTIYEVSATDGSIIKTVNLSPLAGDDPNDPQIYGSESIKFFANGKGVFLVSGKSIFNGKLKVIDSQNGDLVSNINTSFDLSQQYDLEVNYNGTQIYTHDLNDGPTVYKIDEQTLEVTSFIPSDSRRIGAIIPSISSDDQIYEVYFGTYIYNPLNKASTMESTLNAFSNFTNQPGMPRVLYMFNEDNFLYINDFSTLKTLYKYPTYPTTLGGLGQPFATPDGKHLFVIDGDSRTLYLFNTKCFFK